jgi:hypothetical protein
MSLRWLSATGVSEPSFNTNLKIHNLLQLALSRRGSHHAHSWLWTSQCPFKRAAVRRCGENAMAGHLSVLLSRIRNDLFPLLENAFGRHEFVHQDLETSVCQLRRSDRVPFYSGQVCELIGWLHSKHWGGEMRYYNVLISSGVSLGTTLLIVVVWPEVSDLYEICPSALQKLVFWHRRDWSGRDPCNLGLALDGKGSVVDVHTVTNKTRRSMIYDDSAAELCYKLDAVEDLLTAWMTGQTSCNLNTPYKVRKTYQEPLCWRCRLAAIFNLNLDKDERVRSIKSGTWWRGENTLPCVGLVDSELPLKRPERGCRVIKELSFLIVPVTLHIIGPSTSDLW